MCHSVTERVNALIINYVNVDSDESQMVSFFGLFDIRKVYSELFVCGCLGKASSLELDGMWSFKM